MSESRMRALGERIAESLRAGERSPPAADPPVAPRLEDLCKCGHSRARHMSSGRHGPCWDCQPSCNACVRFEAPPPPVAPEGRDAPLPTSKELQQDEPLSNGSGSRWMRTRKLQHAATLAQLAAQAGEEIGALLAVMRNHWFGDSEIRDATEDAIRLVFAALTKEREELVKECEWWAAAIRSLAPAPPEGTRCPKCNGTGWTRSDDPEFDVQPCGCGAPRT